MAEDETRDPTPVQPQPGQSGKVVPPSIKLESFCCPHCSTLTHQTWYSLYANQKDKGSLPFVPGDEFLARAKEKLNLDTEQRKKWTSDVERYKAGRVFFESAETSYSEICAENLHLSRCYTCNKIAVWVHGRLVHPPTRSGPEPNEHLPDPILHDYEEARSILGLSPRGAAALLRLCVEKLCNHLDAEGDNLNQKIADLVTKGLSGRIQQALDVVRVIGNEAVHPGQMDLKDDRETAEMLFGLVNLITEKMISEEKHVNAVYNLIPQSKRDGIENRDKASKKE